MWFICDSGSFWVDVYIQPVSVFQDDSVGDDFRQFSAGVICFWGNILCSSFSEGESGFCESNSNDLFRSTGVNAVSIFSKRYVKI